MTEPRQVELWPCGYTAPANRRSAATERAGDDASTGNTTIETDRRTRRKENEQTALKCPKYIDKAAALTRHDQP